MKKFVSRKKAIEETFPEVETGRKIKETLKPDDAEIVDAPTTPKPKMPLVASLEEKNLYKTLRPLRQNLWTRLNQ